MSTCTHVDNSPVTTHVLMLTCPHVHMCTCPQLTCHDSCPQLMSTPCRGHITYVDSYCGHVCRGHTSTTRVNDMCPQHASWTCLWCGHDVDMCHGQHCVGHLSTTHIHDVCVHYSYPRHAHVLHSSCPHHVICEPSPQLMFTTHVHSTCPFLSSSQTSCPHTGTHSCPKQDVAACVHDVHNACSRHKSTMTLR